MTKRTRSAPILGIGFLPLTLLIFGGAFFGYRHPEWVDGHLTSLVAGVHAGQGDPPDAEPVEDGAWPVGELPAWLDEDEEPWKRRALWRDELDIVPAMRVNLGIAEAMSEQARRAIEEFARSDRPGLAVRRLGESELLPADVELLLQGDLPDILRRPVENEREPAKRREEQIAARRSRSAGKPLQPELPLEIEPLWTARGSYGRVCWFPRADRILALRLSGQCDVFDREGQRVGSFVATRSPRAFTPAILPGPDGTPTPAVVLHGMDKRITAVDLTGLPLWSRSVAGIVGEVAAADLDGDGLDEVAVSFLIANDVVCFGPDGEPRWRRPARLSAFGIHGGNFLERPGGELALVDHRVVDLIGPGGKTLASWSTPQTMLRATRALRPGSTDGLIALTEGETIIAVREGEKAGPIGESALRALADDLEIELVNREGKPRKLLGQVAVASGGGVAYESALSQLIIDGKAVEFDRSLTPPGSAFDVVPPARPGGEALLLIAVKNDRADTTAVRSGFLAAVPLGDR